MSEKSTSPAEESRREQGTRKDAPARIPGHAKRGRRRVGPLRLSVLALVIGIVTGIGAFVFRDLIGFIHNLLFLGQLSFAYDANAFTPTSPWGPFVILVPVVGAIIVTFLVEKFAPEARGHGVPEVMDAIYYKGGAIRPVVAVAKSLTSAVAIGSGASAGTSNAGCWPKKNCPTKVAVPVASATGRKL